jgi:hypothetical protein
MQTTNGGLGMTVSHKTEKPRQHRRMKNILMLAIIMMVALMLPFTGCGNPTIDLTGYGDEPITLIGVQTEAGGTHTIKLTIDELQELDCITMKTESTSDKIGQVSATGPLLDTVLEVYGASSKDYKKIIITAIDGYEIVLNQPFISENKIILAFGINGEPLGDDEAPLRLIIPESDSAYWIRMIKSIEFIPERN